MYGVQQHPSDSDQFPILGQVFNQPPPMAIPAPTKKPLGRQKIEIKPIQKQSTLLTTFSKRRHGLFKKAAELSVISGTKIAIAIEAPSNKKRIYAFGTPDFKTCLIDIKESISRSVAKKKKPSHGVSEFWWEREWDRMQLGELEDFVARLKGLEKEVAEKIIEYEGKRNGTDESMIAGSSKYLAEEQRGRLSTSHGASCKKWPARVHAPPPKENPILRQSDCRAKGGAPGFKVAILGAAGDIGQPLAMRMKMNPLVSVLHLYDVVNAPGVTSDISHMDTGAVVRGFLGQPQLENALTGMDLVLIPACVPRKPGMTTDDLFEINAGFVRTLFEGIAKFCPNAVVKVISNPVNSTLPTAAEVFKKAGTYDPKKLLGVPMLDDVRAKTSVMANSIKELRKENTFLKSKCDKTDVTLMELADERERLKKQLEKTQNQKEKLESLCRSLQAERREAAAVGSDSVVECLPQLKFCYMNIV